MLPFSILPISNAPFSEGGPSSLNGVPSLFEVAPAPHISQAVCLKGSEVSKRWGGGGEVNINIYSILFDGSEVRCKRQLVGLPLPGTVCSL